MLRISRYLVVLVTMLLLFGSVRRAESQTGSFTPIGAVGPFISSIVFDPSDKTGNTIYFGHDEGGGIYKSTDGGATLSNITPLGIQNYSGWTLAIDPAGVLYAGDGFGYGIYKSTTGGASWFPINNGLSTALTSQQRRSYIVPVLLVDPNNPAYIYAFTFGGFYRSTNAGLNWTGPVTVPDIPRLIANQPKDLVSMAISTLSPSKLYGTLFVGGANGKLRYSTDQGATWPLLRDYGAGRMIADIKVFEDANGNLNLYVATVNNTVTDQVLIYSGIFDVNQGLWNDSLYPTPSTMRSLLFARLAVSDKALFVGVWGNGNPGGNGIPASNINDGVWRKLLPDGAWQSIPNGLPMNQMTGWRLAMDPANPAHLFYSTFLSLFQTTNATNLDPTVVKWKAANYNLQTNEATAVAVDPVDSKTFYLGLTNGGDDNTVWGLNNLFIASPSTGGAWQPNPAFRWVANSLSIQPTASSTLLAGTRNNGVRKSIDFGQTWPDMPNSGLSSGYVSRVLFHPDKSLYFNWAFAAVQSPSNVAGIYKSQDYGSTWTPTLTLDPDAARSAFNDVFVLANNPTTIYAVGKMMDAAGNFIRGGVWAGTITDNVMGTITWTFKGPGSLEGFSVAQDPVNPSVLYCGTLLGLYKTTNGGTAWSRIDLAPVTGTPLWQGIITSLLLQDSNNIFVTIYTGDVTPSFLSNPTPGLWRSTNGGSTWARLSGSLLPTDNVWWATFDPNNKSVIYLATYGGGLYQYNVPASP